jgi:hypothetical protein
MDDEQTEKHLMENFPYENLSPGISRRQFFSVLLKEFHLYVNRDEGIVAMKTPELGKLPAEKLVDLIPAMASGQHILIKEKAVWCLPNGKKDPVFLFQVDPITSYTFNLINGRNTIAEISEQLAEKLDLPYPRALAITRGLFLTLVKAGACVPVNNPFVG